MQHLLIKLKRKLLTRARWKFRESDKGHVRDTYYVVTPSGKYPPRPQGSKRARLALSWLLRDTIISEALDGAKQQEREIKGTQNEETDKQLSVFIDSAILEVKTPKESGK